MEDHQHAHARAHRRIPVLAGAALLAAGCGGGEGGIFADAGVDAVADATPDAGPVEWPNAVSFANSDPWIARHHDEIRVMRPRVLALNFVNAKTNDQMIADLEKIIDGIREGSRNHGFADPAAPPFLEYEIAYAIDLRDATPPPGWPYRNSTLYPREDPVEEYWGFDYERLFSDEFAGYYGFDLCDAVDQGLVHEVWVYGDADVPDVGAAEVLEMKPRYDYQGNRLPGEMDWCAGNGCFDVEDRDGIPARCTRSLRIGWVNNTRGPGCFIHSLGHGFESTGRSDGMPYLLRHFPHFADFDLDARFGLPFSSWYQCGIADCLTWLDETTVQYDTGNAGEQGTITNYVPTCGNVHLAPNSRQHYDDQSPYVVESTCRHYGLGDGPGEADAAEEFSTSDFAVYNDLAPDCGGGWQVWWRQAFPGLDNSARDADGLRMKNWWPFLFY
jgi:hypothetical protein